MFHCCNKVTLENVAIKIINKSFLTQTERSFVDEEIEIHEKVKHPNIIEMKESFETQSHIFIVMELKPDGDLANYDLEDKLTGNQIATIINQIL